MSPCSMNIPVVPRWKKLNFECHFLRKVDFGAENLTSNNLKYDVNRIHYLRIEPASWKLNMENVKLMSPYRVNYPVVPREKFQIPNVSFWEKLILVLKT